MQPKTTIRCQVSFELDVPAGIKDEDKRQWAWGKVQSICDGLSSKPKLGLKMTPEVPWEYRKQEEETPK